MKQTVIKLPRRFRDSMPCAAIAAGEHQQCSGIFPSRYNSENGNILTNFAENDIRYDYIF